MQPLPEPLHKIVVDLLLSNHSIRQVATKTGVPRSTVGRISKAIIPNKENIRTGRPPILSPHDKRRIVNQIESGKLDNAVQATEFINSINTSPVCAQTVRNALHECHLKSVVKRKVPMLKPANRKSRLAFAHKYRYWTVEDWKGVLWSDETKILLIGSEGRQWVWKRHGEPINDCTTTPTVKHGGGKMMVWGCMGWNGVGRLVEVQGIMDAKQYVEILEDGIPTSLEKLELEQETFYFQQDNDPKHTLNLAYEWFNDRDINLLDWPPQSPDLNPIEHLWNVIKKRVLQYESPPTSIDQLWARLCEQWNLIPAEVCQNLIESMPRRCEAVIKAKGGHTKY